MRRLVIKHVPVALVAVSLGEVSFDGPPGQLNRIVPLLVMWEDWRLPTQLSNLGDDCRVRTMGTVETNL